jgi:xylulokinase
MSILGLDIGTTGVKAVVFREDGEFVTAPYREYDLKSPRHGHLELDPNEVWDAIRAVLGEAAAATTDDPIRSLATSTLGEAAVPVDEHNRPVGGAIVGFDARGEEAAAMLRKLMTDPEVFEIAGHGVNSFHTLFKILWRREHEPDVFARTKRFLCFGDFAQACLGIDPHIDYSMASRTLAFDVRNLDWSPTILDAVGLTRDVLPPVAAPGTPLGTIGKNDLGLPEDCVVAAGLHDQPAGILGAGIRPGESMLATGTVICLGVRLKGIPQGDAMVENNLCYYPTAGDRQYISIAYNFTGGSLLKWYRDTLAGDELTAASEKGVDPYDVICSDLPNAPTDLLVLPHFATTGTPWLDSRALGAILGLRLTTSRKEIVKAILEGIVHEVKLNADIYAKAGVDIALYKAIGGASRSRTWMQIAADILARPVGILSVNEVAGLGAAVVGARGAGILKSDEEADALIDRCARVVEVLEPRADNVERYAERFAIYRDLYPQTHQISHRLFALSD